MVMDLKDYAIDISNISTLPAFLVNSKTGTTETLSLGTVNSELLDILNIPGSLARITGNGSPAFRYTTETNLSFLFLNIPDNSESVSFGPFFFNNQDSEQLEHTLENLQPSGLSKQTMNRIIPSIPVKSYLFIDAWKELSSAIMDLDLGEIETIREKLSEKEIQYRVEHTEKNRMMNGVISTGYDFERKLRLAIMKGDKHKLREMLVPKGNDSIDIARRGQGFVIWDRINSNTRNHSLSNAITILNTIFRISAENAGIPPVYLHSVSDSIARLIDKAEDSDTLLNIIEQMIESYCDVINRMNIENHSYRITRVQKHIVTHLTEDLHLEELAEIAGTTPQHLSRLFRKECGMTITQYIRKQRINEAKWMIQSSDEPMFSIAESIGFSSQNYFCTVFLKETGMTPSQFKDSCEKTNNPIILDQQESAETTIC